MGKKVVIVGGVAGGASAAARLRRLDEQAEIVILERDEYISYANCGLPYYIGETIRDRGKLIVRTPEGMKSRFNLDVKINCEAVGVDTAKKIVKVKSRKDGEYEEHYDYLVLSPGVKAMRPNIPGIRSSMILTLKNISDTDRLKAYVDNQDIRTAVVVGGGYVGVEMAENLKLRGLEVTLVEAAPHILAPLDTDMVVVVEQEIRDQGVGLILNDGVKAFQDQGREVEITLNSGIMLRANLVVLAIGVVPDTEFLKNSDIALGAKGQIIVSEKMETNVPGVYAVGDAIEITDFVTKQKGLIPLAGPANKQGRIAADNIAGLSSTYKGTQGTAIIKAFDLTAASTGSNVRTLKSLSIPHKEITIHAESRAAFYPGGAPLTLKLIFDDEGNILGAQGVGRQGVDKRIDIMATVIRLGGTVDDLAELELCYAPPFSSAKDPVNIAGYVAQNILAGRVDSLTWDEFAADDQEKFVLIDVRTEAEYRQGHFAGAQNIPLDNLRDRIEDLDKDKTIYGYCQVGLRGYVAARILSQNGFTVKNLSGGYKSALTMSDKPEITTG